MFIEFIHSGKAYLPELTAYQEYFKKLGHQVGISDSPTDGSKADVVWRFMGVDRAASSGPVIHEYGSLSTGFAPKCKDLLKKRLSTKPAGRVFLNSFIAQRMSFGDDVPGVLRNMGVHRQFFRQPQVGKVYDFVYIGSITRARSIDRLCQSFKSSLAGKSLLLIGEPEAEIYQRFRGAMNITFAGRQAYEDIPALAVQARYGVNVTPDVYPYNQQTSTKLLEYCALGLGVVTTPGAWVSQFMRERNANFFVLDSQLSGLSSTAIDEFDYITPDVSDLEWGRLLASIRLAEWVESLIV